MIKMKDIDEIKRNEFRENLIGSLRENFLGPKEGTEEEISSEKPTNRYFLGVLYPQYSPMEEEDESVEEGPGGAEDDDPNSKNLEGYLAVKPSSMGLSFRLEKSTEELPIQIRYAYYEKEGDRYQRHEIEKDISIPISEGGGEETYPSGPDLSVEWSIDEGDESRLVSIFLLNEGIFRPDTDIDEQCIFTPQIRLDLDDKRIIAQEEDSIGDTRDERTLSLLYHDRFEFGVGHGCSVKWSDTEDNRCSTLETTFFPTFLKKTIDFQDEKFSLFMKELSDEGDKDAVISPLYELIEGYEDWIEETFSSDNKENLSDGLEDISEEHETLCRESLDRMKSGVELLEKDRTAFEAFCFMNKVIWLQLVHSDIDQDGSFPPDYEDERFENFRWRPFQMAFILQNLSSVYDPKDEERELVDLLWIPTGGGKTEAYLGLCAFSMAKRRLESDLILEDYVGTDVLMRYTLRLLTIQQFQRATRLICACEKVRSQRPERWGEEPFTIGLYVGRSTTPNRIGNPGDIDSDGDYGERDTAYCALAKWDRDGEPPNDTNPAQIMNCPWCGERLDRECYVINDDDRLTIRCKNPDCLFYNNEHGIPALTVDENIYRYPPSMVIATVDKFAMLPYKSNVSNLFGIVDRYCPKHGFDHRPDMSINSHRGGPNVREIDDLKPPNLIIQDELHLINGPLGSMVGIYEPSIEYLSSKRVRDTRPEQTKVPKYIASTATISNGANQIWNLYIREMATFPAPGLSIDDSFFIKRRSSERGKKYLGIYGGGVSLKTQLMRVLSRLSVDTYQGQEDEDIPLETWDYYSTVVSFFNSIRALGSAKTLMEDDVKGRVLDLTEGGKDELMIEELTSRVPSSDLPEILNKLETKSIDPDSPDILACSNMFSVGVDVPRLGLMVMDHQPKTTSEYLQSTGRVGRKKDGLVIVLYNWARPRDQSHFERFYDYHNKIHKHVESMSVTPFSVGTREKSIHAQYVSLMRALYPNNELRKNTKAANFRERHRSSYLSSDIKTYLRTRMSRIRSEGIETNQMEEELESFLDDWLHERNDDLRYVRWYGSNEDVLLYPGQEGESIPTEGLPYLTPSSLRTVEKTVPIHFLKRNRGGGK